jgi:Putative peptidoglycan binding domain
MGLRFYRSRGVIGFVRWNIREAALMLRLWLMKAAENIRSRNVPSRMAACDTGGSRSRPLSGWPPPASTEMPTAEGRPTLQLSTTAHARRIALKVAVMAVLFLGGYLICRFTNFDNAPTSNANASQAQVEPPAPEPLAPLVLASQVSVVQSGAQLAAMVPPPVSEVAAPKPAGKQGADTRPLNSDEVLETQAWLKAFGFDPGPLDGLAGPKTTVAVKRYRVARQMEEAGGLDRSVLQQVRQQVGQSSR